MSSNFTKGQRMKKEDNLVVVDLMTLAHRYKHKKQFTFASDMLKTIMSIANSYSAKDVIVTSDYGKSAYRLSLFPEYKGDLFKFFLIISCVLSFVYVK